MRDANSRHANCLQRKSSEKDYLFLFPEFHVLRHAVCGLFLPINHQKGNMSNKITICLNDFVTGGVCWSFFFLNTAALHKNCYKPMSHTLIMYIQKYRKHLCLFAGTVKHTCQTLKSLAGWETDSWDCLCVFTTHINARLVLIT